eukprot:c13352_g1_i2 orf=239-1666(+)
MAMNKTQVGTYATSNFGGEEKPTRFGYETIRRHCKPGDCWLIIWGKVYDVTSWVPHHPGGSFIYMRAGQDVTQLFDSYHPLWVREKLPRYYIGEVEESSGDQLKPCTGIEYDAAGQEDFYLTLKQRVEAHFMRLKVNPRVHPHMFIKSIIVLAGYILCYYLTFFGLPSFWFSLLFAVATGFMAAEVGLSIQHDANHGAYSNIPKLGYLMSVSLDFIGASSFMWRHQHVVGHHSFTNVNNYDPDIRVKDPDVRRVSPDQPKQAYHRYQHLYLGPLYGLLALKGVLIDDFVAFISGSIGSIEIPEMTSLESYIFWGGKLLYALYMFVLPAVFSNYNTLAIVCLYIVMELVAGWVLAFLFQVAHVVEAASFPTVVPVNGSLRVPNGWAALQVSTTVNFSTDSMLWTHLSGGLNFQIEHHLFPAVCHMHYPSIQHIVKATCSEFNLPYKCYPNLWHALRAHFAHLKKVGLYDFEFRLNG